MRLGRTWVIVAAIALSIAAFIIWQSVRVPPGVVPKGGEETVAWLALATSIVSLLTAIIGLIERLLANRARSNR